MKVTLPHSLGDHPWQHVEGAAGLFLDFVFSVFVVLAVSLMLIFCTALVFFDFLISPILGIMSRFHLRPAAPS